MLSLDLTEAAISDISALAEMKELERLELRATAVADLSPLTEMTRLYHLDLFDTPVTDLSPLAETTSLGLELGGPAVKKLAPLVGMRDARISLYKYPHESVPKALESRPKQVRIRPIYKRHGE
jgi:Leucine-rich repeat (LRR) protein